MVYAIFKENSLLQLENKLIDLNVMGDFTSYVECKGVNKNESEKHFG